MSSDPAPTATAPTRRRAPLGDRIGSALCVLVALLVIERSLAYGLSGTSQVVGAGAFPFGLGLALLGLGAVWAWQSWHGLVPPPRPTAGRARACSSTGTAICSPATTRPWRPSLLA
mgnify:CR=1 FL=1